MSWPLNQTIITGIRSAHGTWLSAQPTGPLECNRTVRDAWEMFEISAVTSAMVSIRSVAHDQYVSARPEGTVACNRSWVREWEMWTPYQVGPTTFGFKSFHGKFLVAELDGTVLADRDELNGWERFDLI